MDIALHSQNYLLEIQACIDHFDHKMIGEITDIIYKAYQDKKRIFVFGNGGSATTAAHMMCDFNKGVLGHTGEKDIGRFKIIALCDNIASITAWSNDTSYDRIFVEPLKNLYEDGDIVIGISVSGNSPNVVKACEYVKEQKGTVIAFTGAPGGKLKEIANKCFVANSPSYEIAEDIHLILVHMLKKYFLETL